MAKTQTREQRAEAGDFSAVGADAAGVEGVGAIRPVPSSQPETVTVPASTLAAMQARLEQLELRLQLRDDAALHPTKLLDEAWQREKAELSRPASERTQDAADRKYGTEAPRFRVRLESVSESGSGKGPNIAEHFPLLVSASSDLEAGARYLSLMGITKHDHRLVVEPAA